MTKSIKIILHQLKMQWYELQIKALGAWNFFLKQQKSLEKSLLKKYYNKEAKQKVSSDIIFTCNGYLWAGGLADRLRAIIAIYSWCKKIVNNLN